MSFAGFVFDMIKRDKENHNLRNLRRERAGNRLDKMYKGHNSIPQNTTPEEMEKIARLTTQKEQSEQHYSVKMTLVIFLICVAVISILVLMFIK